MTHPSLRLRSTGGSFAFVDLKPERTAQCIRQLLDAGCIIIGKANLSVRLPLFCPFIFSLIIPSVLTLVGIKEFANFK